MHKYAGSMDNKVYLFNVVQEYLLFLTRDTMKKPPLLAKYALGPYNDTLFRHSALSS